MRLGIPRSHSSEPCGMILVTTLARMTLLASFSPSRLAGQEGQHPQTPSCIRHIPQHLCSISFLHAPPYCLRFRTQFRGLPLSPDGALMDTTELEFAIIQALSPGSTGSEDAARRPFRAPAALQRQGLLSSRAGGQGRGAKQGG